MQTFHEYLTAKKDNKSKIKRSKAKNKKNKEQKITQFTSVRNDPSSMPSTASLPAGGPMQPSLS